MGKNFNPEDFKDLMESESFQISEKGDSIIMKIRDYKGKKSIDIRRYYVNDTGHFLPTAKGISIPLDDVDNPAEEILQEALNLILRFQESGK